MKKRRGGKPIPKKDADLDRDVENYVPSDSDDGLNEEDMNLISTARGRRQKEGEEEVLKVYSSSEDDDDDDDDGVEGAEEEEAAESSDEDKELYGGGVGSDMDSDIEGKAEDDGLPDSKAWGSDKKQYYDTDYVDKDYLGFDDEEAAIEEEKEADMIQRRMLAQLEDTDFTLGLLDTVEHKKKDAAKKRDEPQMDFDEEKVEVDLSKLSKEEFIDLMKRKNPEMFPIIEKCKERMKYLEEKVAPILELVDSNALKRSKVIDFLENLHQLILHYSVNVLFYIHLKEQNVPTSNHAVLKRINGLDYLIKEMDILRKTVDPEIDIVLEKAANGDDINGEDVENPPVPEPKNRKERRKRKLEILKKKEEHSKMIAMEKEKLIQAQNLLNVEETLSKKAKMQEKKAVVYSEDESSDEEDLQDEKESADEKSLDPKEKRSVTFEMLKNKGLTPHRKKENRNPRVKHRNKFKKALVRRKGQVREARKEIKKYGGEISGINAFVSKSIKLK